MQGPSIDDQELKGIIPRMIQTVFEGVMNADEDIEFLVKASYLEIYMEHIRDLLDGRKDNLKIREDKTKGIWVEGATEVYVSKELDVLDIIRTGQSNRAIAFTKMNAESSRSHSIFVLNISQKNLKNGSSKSGKLYLVDLAGSEKVGKTGAQGTTLDEAKMINKSLSALGNVINSLTDGKSGHIPYRDSKLTRILQESLGGNSRTTLIINCSPSSYNEAETLSTLRFGNRAKSIKNKAKVNQERSAAELSALLAKAEAEIERLKAYIKGGGTGSIALDSEADSKGNIALQEKCLDLEQKLAAGEEDKRNTQDQLDSLNDTLQEKESELANLQLELQKLNHEVQTLTKENGELSMQFADMKMATDRVRYESTEQALVIDTLTSENNVIRGELQLLQEQVRNLEEEKELRQQEKADEEPDTPAEAHTEKSSPVKRYSTEWAQKEEQLKRELEEGFLSSSTEDTVAKPTLSSEEVQSRIAELEEAIKQKDATFEEEQRKQQATHGLLTSQHSQLQLVHVDLQSQLQARDTEIEQLKAKLEAQTKRTHLIEQQDQQDQYRRTQDAKWQQQKDIQVAGETYDELTAEQAGDKLAEGANEELQAAPKHVATEMDEHATKEKDEAYERELTEFKQRASAQDAEIARLIQENNALKAKAQAVVAIMPTESPQEKLKELESANKELRVQFDTLEQATKANEEASKAKLESEIKRLQNQTSVKLAEFASMRDALLLDLENRCQKVVDLEMLLDDYQDKYHTLLAQMKKAGGKQQHYELLQQKLDLATSAKHQLSIDNNKLKLDLQVATKQLALRDGHIGSLESLLKDTQERFHKLAKGYETLSDELAKYKEGGSTNGVGGTTGPLFGRTRTNSAGLSDNARIARPLRGGGGHHNPTPSITAAISSASPPPRSNNSSVASSLTSLPPMPSPFNLSNNYTTSSSSPLRTRPTDSPATPNSANNTPYGQNSIWDIFRGAKKGSPKPASSYPATPSTPSTPLAPTTPASPYPISLPSTPQTPASPPPVANTNSYAPAVPTSPFVPSTPPQPSSRPHVT